MDTQSYQGVLSSPLLEILHVKIQKSLSNPNPNPLFSSPDNNNNNKPCKVYGTIKLKDGHNNLFNLFNKDITEPQTLQLGRKLPLTGPTQGPILSYSVTNIELNLKDAARDHIELANGVLYIDHMDKCDIDNKYFTFNFIGEFGFEVVVTTINYEYAVVASPKLTLLRGRPISVYGKVFAKCGNLQCDDECGEVGRGVRVENSKSGICIFDKRREDRVEVGGGVIELSRGVIIVPGYLSLVIEVYLFSGRGEEVFMKRVQFPARFRGSDVVEVEGKGGVVMEVRVDWSHAYSQPKAEKCGDDDHNLGFECRRKSILAQPRLLKGLSNFRPLIGAHEPPGISMSDVAMEVFSVTYSRFDRKERSYVYGTVKVNGLFGSALGNDVQSSFSLFERDQDHAERIRANEKMRCLVFPSFALRGPPLSMDISLKDVNGAIISNGSFYWDERNILKPISWFDKPLCSVIRGDHGYAMVHYAIFTGVVRANLKVLFFLKNSSEETAKVSGRLFIGYNDYKISTLYERKYYRNEIYVKGPKNTAILSSESEIPLSKNVVCFPKGSSMSVKLDLRIQKAGASHHDSMVGLGGGVRFRALFSDEVCHEFETQNYRVRFIMEWTIV